MRKLFLMPTLLSLLICCNSCVDLDEKTVDKSPTIEGVAVEGVPGLKIHGDVARSDSPPPPATTTGGEPAITSAEFVAAADGSFELVVTVNSNYPISRLYVVLNGNTYIIGGGVGVSREAIDICKVSLETQGLSCTPKCLDACSCAACSDSEQEHAVEGACAVTCSNQAHFGLIGPGQTWSSEIELVYQLYNGIPEAPGSGFLLSFPSCSAGQCTSAASKQRRQGIRLKAQDWQPVFSTLTLSTLVAQSTPPNDTPITSPPFMAAGVKLPCGGNAMACR